MLDMIARSFPTTPSNGIYRDMEDADNQKGPERDETDQFHQLVRRLVADGDSRAAKAGRRTRRTLAEMRAALMADTDHAELSKKLAEINKRSSGGSGR